MFVDTSSILAAQLLKESREAGVKYPLLPPNPYIDNTDAQNNTPTGFNVERSVAAAAKSPYSMPSLALNVANATSSDSDTSLMQVQKVSFSSGDRVTSDEVAAGQPQPNEHVHCPNIKSVIQLVRKKRREPSRFSFQPTGA